jgi:pimeloyl-ACP methyl ester carboxylesterase
MNTPHPDHPSPAAQHTWTAADGLRLAATVHAPRGEDRRVDVLCLAGLTRNARDFAPLAETLAARGHRVVAMDYRGRGASQHAANWRSYSIEQEADDIDRGLATLDLTRFAVVGTSRGGIHGMLLGLRRREALAGLVLNDIGARIEAAGLARIARAMGGEPAVRDWAAAAAHARAGLAAQFPRMDDADWERFAHQIYRETDTGPLLDHDPALSHTLDDTRKEATAPDLSPVFAGLAGLPVMVIRGALSDILARETVAEMAATHPGLATLTVPDEGHAPLLWDAASRDAIADFLAPLS